MKLYLKQKVFSFRDRFYVKDESGADKYAVEGEILSWGKKLHVSDTSGAEVAFIREKVLTWLPRFFVEIGGVVACEVVKEFTFFKPRYRLEGTNWRLEGNLWEHDYYLYDGNSIIMHLSKKWFTWGDSYELEIANPQNELMCLCVALAVDCVLESQGAAAAGASS